MGRHKKVVENLEDKNIADRLQGGFKTEYTDDTPDRLANLERANTGIYRRLDEIELRIAKLENPIKEVKVEPVKIEEHSVPEFQETHFPVPIDYQEAVKTLLNSKFGIKIDALPDRPQFSFTIVVPREYSPLSPVEWQTAKGDLRTRILNYSDGINGVREWITKVFDSFNPEVKAKIKLEI